MDLIVSLVNVDFIVLILPMMSFMLYDFMQPEMVFEKYGKWLQTINPFIGKPLGLCLKCMHIWICILFFVFFGQDFYKFILLLPVSYLILLKLYY